MGSVAPGFPGSTFQRMKLLLWRPLRAKFRHREGLENTLCLPHFVSSLVFLQTQPQIKARNEKYSTFLPNRLLSYSCFNSETMQSASEASVFATFYYEAVIGVRSHQCCFELERDKGLICRNKKNRKMKVGVVPNTKITQFLDPEFDLVKRLNFLL